MTDQCYCDYQSTEFYHVEVRRARTIKTCYECGRAILPGERYEHVRGKWDGDVGTFRTCARCLDLREFVTAHVPCVCWYHGNMLDDALGAVDEFAHETIGLKFGALRRYALVKRQPRRKEPKP